MLALLPVFAQADARTVNTWDFVAAPVGLVVLLVGAGFLAGLLCGYFATRAGFVLAAHSPTRACRIAGKDFHVIPAEEYERLQLRR